ncbi:MAG: GNAT family N-acetyltransferase [Desulfobacterales bacterium]|nr:GNAT family N-acetyltransferase [Desulfobacterales bacterium]MBF0395616.1 GNAT family N-acetyltransferase [Desulfobacterales bacterium]
MKIRYNVKKEDCNKIKEIVELTNFFNEKEVDVAVELIKEHIAKGVESGYHFVFSEVGEKIIGYTCYGPIACTTSSYDIYWIVVNPDYQGKGIGKKLLMETESLILKAGGSRSYIETSCRLQYNKTRAFYERCGYNLASVLKDFYDKGDDKATYCKILET